MSYQRFKFVRPFVNVSREGWPSQPSIVAFGRRGYEQKVYQVFPGIKGTPEKTYISKYQYKLILNLWFVIFYFEWIGRLRKAPHA